MQKRGNSSANALELRLFFIKPLMCSVFHYSPTSDGSAAAILASEAFVKKHGLASQAVEIVAQAMATDLPSTFQDKSIIKLVSVHELRVEQCLFFLYLLW